MLRLRSNKGTILNDIMVNPGSGTSMRGLVIPDEIVSIFVSFLSRRSDIEHLGMTCKALYLAVKKETQKPWPSRCPTTTTSSGNSFGYDKFFLSNDGSRVAFSRDMRPTDSICTTSSQLDVWDRSRGYLCTIENVETSSSIPQFSWDNRFLIVSGTTSSQERPDEEQEQQSQQPPPPPVRCQLLFRLPTSNQNQNEKIVSSLPCVVEQDVSVVFGRPAASNNNHDAVLYSPVKKKTRDRFPCITSCCITANNNNQDDNHSAPLIHLSRPERMAMDSFADTNDQQEGVTRSSQDGFIYGRIAYYTDNKNKSTEILAGVYRCKNCRLRVFFHNLKSKVTAHRMFPRNEAGTGPLSFITDIRFSPCGKWLVIAHKRVGISVFAINVDNFDDISNEPETIIVRVPLDIGSMSFIPSPASTLPASTNRDSDNGTMTTSSSSTISTSTSKTVFFRTKTPADARSDQSSRNRTAFIVDLPSKTVVLGALYVHEAWETFMTTT